MGIRLFWIWTWSMGSCSKHEWVLFTFWVLIYLMLIWLVTSATVFCQAYLNLQNAEAHEYLLRQINVIVMADNGAPLQWCHIDSESLDKPIGILHWTGDQHGGQAKGEPSLALVHHFESGPDFLWQASVSIYVNWHSHVHPGLTSMTQIDSYCHSPSMSTSIMCFICAEFMSSATSKSVQCLRSLTTTCAALCASNTMIGMGLYLR